MIERISVCVVVGCLALAANGAAQGSHPILDAPGFQTNHEYLSPLPFEHADTASGGLTLRFTELALPGNGGRVLRFQRAYNSKTNQWTYGIEGVALFVSSVWPAESPLSADPDPVLHTVDGGDHVMAFQLNPEPTVEGRRVMVDDQFRTFDRSSGTLWLPDGSKAIYSGNRLDTLYDAFGKVVLTVAWGTNSAEFHQYVSDTEYRTIGMTWSTCGGLACEPRTLTYDGNTWNYTRPEPGSPILRVDLPEGLSWVYDETPTTMTVTTPHGGWIEFAFEERMFENIPEWGEYVMTEVLTSRKTFDRDGQLEGTWTYTYDMPSPEFSNRTDITAPSGVVTSYYHEFVGPPGTGAPDYIGRTYLVTRRVVQAGTDVLEEENREYGLVPVYLGSLPELTRRTITRGTDTFTTEYCYSAASYGDFHRPNKVIETGELQRTSVRQYLHSTDVPIAAPYVVGMLTSDHVTVGASATCETDPVGGTTVAAARTYNAVTGFVESETVSGVTTTFTPDALGNLERITRANGSWVQQGFSRGQVSSVTTSEPGYQISRVINPDGTVASETQAGRTTTYSYDALGRPTVIDPPGNAAGAATAYDPAGTTVTTTRGISQVVTTVDGFGRVIRTVDSAGVQTETEYDAEGRVTFASLPYTGSAPVGTSTTYDDLGRVRQETHADGTFRQYTYNGNTLTIRDENGRNTVLTRQAFGHPDDVRFTAIADAAGQTWTYGYTAAGQLESVAGPGGVTRTWTYDTNELLRSETHPESGTVTYNTYDAAGLLTQKTDARGQVTSYTYDGNDRLKTITSGGSTTTITYEAGSDNLASTTVDGVTSTFAYDDAGRLRTRTDTVDGKPFAVVFDYDGNDNVTQITYPTGRKVAYAYGPESRLTRVFNPSTNADYASAFTYHASGALTGYTAGNGIPTTIAYDPTRYWITGITSGEMSLGYGTYDGVGNVGTIADPHAGNQTFTYDVLDRLASATGGYGSIVFAYDAHGNRQVPGTYVYEAGNPFRLQSVDGGASTMTYDGNGNLATGPNAAFSYTPANLLASSTVGPTQTSFAYDADAWRVKKAVAGGATVYYVRGPTGQLLMEWTNSSPVATVREYVYAGSRLLAVLTGDVPPK